MNDFKALHELAHAAGNAAALATRPRAMVVFTPKDGLFGNNEPDLSKPVYHEPEGMCGFAWVKMPGNAPYGRWMKKQGLANKGYPSGLTYWISGYGQSVERKEAYANAYARVVKEAGVPNVYADSRLD